MILLLRRFYLMNSEQRVQFMWESQKYNGYVEKEYENSFLVVVNNPSPTITEKYLNRMIIRKKDCSLQD